MLRSIQKLIGDKRKQLIFPIFLMSLDAIGSLVMYLMLYFTVIHLLNGSLTGGLVRNYTIVCLISVILRLIIYRSGYFLCFSRGAEMCSGLRLDLANHYRSLSLGYFNQNSSGYLLSTLTKDLSNFELALSALLIAFEHSYNLLKELKLATSNLEQAFDTKPLSYKEEKVKLSHFDITFENVNFSYNQQADVLHNISFHAPEGSTTALIGPSGSGKSTVANLIARFWDVTKGCVRIGGQDIRELNPDGLLHYISEVFQENTLLSDTIYNNIKAGREDATEQEVIAAAKAAHCHEFIERLPNGYQTHLAEGGNTLSGGEKQRIAIARAILKDAPILLLDESTASLDADNEAKINQALDRLMKGKTVFVIAHRLNTIQNADQIIVLNQGRIEETGTHEELLRKKGHYYEMVQEQQKAREWIVKGA